MDDVASENALMRTWCVFTANEVMSPADLIVFPEGISEHEMRAAAQANPASFIVGAVTIEDASDGDRKLRSLGILFHQGQNRIGYVKVGTDGRTVGTNKVVDPPVYESTDLCVGVLICMDVDVVPFARSVVEAVRTSRARWKVVCIPADMASYWFSSDISPMFAGLYVVVCNHTKTYQAEGRCKSFCADPDGRKVVVQYDVEPISYEVP